MRTYFYTPENLEDYDNWFADKESIPSLQKFISLHCKEISHTNLHVVPDSGEFLTLSQVGNESEFVVGARLFLVQDGIQECSLVLFPLPLSNVIDPEIVPTFGGLQ